jgi:hypothetical protein
MTKEFVYVLGKFPDHRDKIIDLYNKDEDFRTLCEDYVTSIQAAEERRLNAIKDRKIEREFLHVNMELEKEIIRLLETYQQRI